MSELATYSARERLRDGREVQIRALRAEDKQDFLSAVAKTSAKTLYRRFFGAKREFSEKEIAFFLDVDFKNHVALIACVTEHGQSSIAGAGRYVMINPGVAEIAFTVVDAYQRLGIGSILMRHLTELARRANLQELTADVLLENAPMIKVFEKSGLPLSKSREGGLVHITLRLQ
jgi:ribosomal protein S18 acetylase RimI-like enzyme